VRGGLGLSVPVTYAGRRFAPADAPAGGTVATWYQDGDLVWAEIAGPALPVGRLVGSVRPDGVVDAAYCFVTPAGIVAGECVSTPEVLPDGRVRLTERWRRVDGSSGVSYAEEIR
jgi:hypothetical protein